MAQWICVLLLVVVTAVVTSGYNSYGGYPPKIARPDVYNSYPVHNHVVIHHRGVVDPGYHRHPGMGSYLKKYHGFKIRHGRFSYNGIGYKLNCGKMRFYRLWKSCYIKYHSRGRCFGRFRKQHIFAVYNGHTHGGHYESRKYYKFHSHGHGHVYRHGHGDGYSHGLRHGVSNYSYYKKYHELRIQHHRFSYGGKGHHGYTSHGAGYGHGHGYHGHNNIYKHLNLHKKIDTHHVQRIHHTANSHVSAISHLSNIHVRNIQYEANKHVSRISDEANKHINKFRQLVNHHINRLHKQAKHHLSAVEYQHKRYLSESEYQKKRHLARKEHLHKKHEYYLSKHYSMVDYGYDQGHVVTYLDYYKKYHGFRIDHDRFSYGGKAYTLKCESKQFYSLWSDCWSQYHSRSTCFANLRKQHLFIDYPGDHADPYTPTNIVLETIMSTKNKGLLK